ncbi:YheC/YheD family endospore coat-associated protein [Paenibacillus endoradicis]|uniref:YheC/YheD family endospore coat-associated protein n=1 Tax=Paenibacillus endoradicis TaxID=2972487 RepID=UPI002158CAD8|nr:YheC/YheD family protein [Paenibacillus endoradicis]MCR8657949.1 YheC/YheD family protein [Paenibacillus endoradicis]
MARLLLGILTLYLNDGRILEERKIYEQMTIEGAELGIQVIVFTPEDVSTHQAKVRAHYYDLTQKRWTRKWGPIPKYVFDRCRVQKSHRMKLLQTFKAQYPQINYLNKPIGHKWNVHQKLEEHHPIRPYLPHTIHYSNVSDIVQMLNIYKVIYLKPVNGTGGRGILRIERSSNQMFYIEGRDHNRNIISPRKMSISSLSTFLQKWNVLNANYLVQQGIPLQLSNGRVHDYRVLVQKDGTGEWNVTGCAGRIGAKRSITANLHGGGSAVPMEKLMRNFINSNVNLSAVQAEVNYLSIEIASYLDSYISALCELAIDIAIDREGQIWIIEINPKPAREVFKEIGNLEVYKTAIRRPLEYAKYRYLKIEN